MFDLVEISDSAEAAVEVAAALCGVDAAVVSRAELLERLDRVRRPMRPIGAALLHTGMWRRFGAPRDAFEAMAIWTGDGAHRHDRALDLLTDALGTIPGAALEGCPDNERQWMGDVAAPCPLRLQRRRSGAVGGRPMSFGGLADPASGR